MNLYTLARYNRDAKAVVKAVRTGSPKPILKRIANKLIGRFLVSKLWVR